MRTSRYLAIAAFAALLLTPTVAHASDPGPAASNVLTYGSTSGTAVAIGDTLSSPLKSGTGGATFFSSATGTTGITCATSNFQGTVGTNPVPPPSTATGSLTVHNFSNCTDNISGATVLSVTVNNLPFNISIDSSTDILTVTGSIQTTVILRTIFGTNVTCKYEANAGPTGGPQVTGAASNADNSVSFVDEPFHLIVGPGLCFANAFFTATYAPVTGPGGTVFVN